MQEVADILTVTLNPAVDRLIEGARLVPGGPVRCEATRRTPGGKGVNVSRVLAQMERPSVATGFLGEDNLRSFTSLFGERIGDAFVRLPGSTRENLTLLDRSTGEELHLRDCGLAVDAHALEALREVLAAHIGEGSIVVFSGSLPPGVEPDRFGALLDQTIAAGARVVVDSSGDALSQIAGRRLWLVKPNALELGELVGRALPSQDDLLAAARELAEDVELVLLSCGGGGAYLVSAAGTLHAEVALSEPVRNSVGCGDALLGAFVGGWPSGSPGEALSGAVAIATASVAHPEPATFDPAMAARLRDEVKVRQLEKVES